MLKFLRILFNRRATSKEETGDVQPIPAEEGPFVYCLVGNIVEERFDKSRNEFFRGTKHFSAGTKVYCYPPKWGDGYENIKVIGKHRGAPRMVTMVIASKHITNWRLKTVYNPFIVKEMRENGGWPRKEDLIQMLNSLKKESNRQVSRNTRINRKH